MHVKKHEPDLMTWIISAAKYASQKTDVNCHHRTVHVVPAFKKKRSRARGQKSMSVEKNPELVSSIHV